MLEYLSPSLAKQQTYLLVVGAAAAAAAKAAMAVIVAFIASEYGAIKMLMVQESVYCKE